MATGPDPNPGWNGPSIAQVVIGILSLIVGVTGIVLSANTWKTDPEFNSNPSTTFESPLSPSPTPAGPTHSEPISSPSSSWQDSPTISSEPSTAGETSSPQTGAFSVDLNTLARRGAGAPQSERVGTTLFRYEFSDTNCSRPCFDDPSEDQEIVNITDTTCSHLELRVAVLPYIDEALPEVELTVTHEGGGQTSRRISSNSIDALEVPLGRGAFTVHWRVPSGDLARVLFAGDASCTSEDGRIE